MAGPQSEGALVRIPAGRHVLEGNLAIPEGAQGIVLFAHGSGSSRFSPRNRHVAAALRRGDLATLLVDLLTAEEEEVDLRTAHLRFDVRMLAARLEDITDWLTGDERTSRLRIGLFGASTGAAAALIAASHRPEAIRAVVSRGGRPDLAGDALGSVRAPSLLLVGSDDSHVIRLNRDAFRQMTCERRLEIIPGAGHLFEEPGTLDKVAALARDWFQLHLTGSTHPA